MATPTSEEYPGLRGRQEIARRFMDACEILGYGMIHIEVVNGLPKIITTIHQTIRLDLTNPKEEGIIKTNKATDHDDGQP